MPASPLSFEDLALWSEFLEEEEFGVLLGLDDGAEYGSLAPATFPATLLRIRVELLLGGVWTDVSPYVLYEEMVRIERGRRPNQRRADSAKCTLTFKNHDQRFSPRNASGPWFGLLRRNTPLRVWANPGNGDRLRFTGKVPVWRPSLRGHPNDRRVTVTAYGVRNRIERPSSAPIRSAQTRYLSTQAVLSYRSLEGEVVDATEGPPGSGPLPDLARGGVFSDNVLVPEFFHAFGGFVPSADGSVRVEVDVKWPADPGSTAAFSSALRWNMSSAGDDYITNWSLEGSLSGTGAGPVLVFYFANGTSASIGGAGGVTVFDGEWHHYQIDMFQDGTQVTVNVTVDGDGGNPNSSTASIVSGGTGQAHLGHALNWYTYDSVPANGMGRLPAMGQVVFYGPIPLSSQSYQAFTGWTGETAAERWLRLLGEEGIAAVVREGFVDDITMGPQGLKTLQALLDECEDACEGVADETTANEYRLSTLRSRYNQPVVFALDYDHGGQHQQVLPPLEPLDDDERSGNDWTLTSMSTGASSQYQLLTGPNNVNDPEDDELGVGRYPESEQINLERDSDLFAAASFRVTRATVDLPRFGEVLFDLARNPELLDAWLDNCDIGARMRITDPPADVGPADVDAILEGYAEEFNQVYYRVGAYLEPADIYRMGTVARDSAWGPDTPRLDCGGSTLSTALLGSEFFGDGFESGVGAWNGQSGWTVALDATVSRSGAQSMKLTPPGATASGGGITAARYPASAGTSYTTEAWFASAAGWSDARAAVDWYDSSGAFITSSLGSATVVPAGMVWTVSRQVFTAPAGTASMQPRARQGGTPAASDVLWVDDVTVQAQLQIAITDNCAWTHDWGDYPVTIGGEDMLLTGVSAVGGSYPAQTQTLTVVRSLNGVALDHAAGAAVHVRYPIILAR